jgi:hypothetical protein
MKHKPALEVLSAVAMAKLKLPQSQLRYPPLATEQLQFPPPHLQLRQPPMV